MTDWVKLIGPEDDSFVSEWTHLAWSMGKATIPLSSTRYSNPLSNFPLSDSEESNKFVVQADGKIKDLRILTLSSQPASGAVICTVRVNEANTALTATVPLSHAAGEFLDNAHEITVEAGDIISVGFVNAATAESAKFGSVSFRFTPTN